MYNGVCLKGRISSSYNPPNVIIVMFVIESVLEARFFHGNEICVITPYREQATMRARYNLEVVTHTSKEHILKIAQTWQLCVLLWK